MTTRVPGTELDEIRREEDRFAALVERELRGAARAATEAIGEVTVAQGSPVAASPDDLNGIVADWRRRLSTSILPFLERLIGASVSAQVAGVNTAMGARIIEAFDEQLVTRLLLEGAENRMVNIGNELWENARNALAEGVANGESIQDISRAVQDAAGVTAPRATTTARTEVIGASNRSSIEVMRASGLVTQKEWLATFDQRVRLSHIEAHAQVVPLDGAFSVGGAQLDHPGDFAGPAEEVINCRCAMGYVVDEDAPEDALTAATEHNHNGAMIALVPTEEDVKRLALELDEAEPADELHMTMYYLGDADAWSAKQREALVNALSTYDWDHEGDTGALSCRAFGLAHWNPHSDTPCWVLNIGGDDISDVRAVIDDQLSRLNGEVPLPKMPAQHRPFAAHLCLAYTSDTSPELIEQLKERMGDVAFDRVRIAFAGESVDISLRGTMSTKASAAPAAAEVTVDWFIEKNHEECSDERPWAVVKASDGAVEGCHETREDATAQLRALLQVQAEEREDEVEEEIDAAVQVAATTTVDTETFQDECPPGQHREDGQCVWNAGLAFFEGVAVVEGEWTGDGRQFAPDSLTWEQLDEIPVTLQWQKETNHGGINDVTVSVGRLTSLERSGVEIRVAGYIDGGSEDGAEVIRRLGVGTLGGVSIVADDPEQAEVEFVYPEGCNLEEATPEEIDEMPLDEINRCLFPSGMIFHSGRIRALTLVDTPAFVEATIHLVENESTEDTGGEEPVVISEEFGAVKTDDIKQLYRQLSPVDINDPQSVAQLIDELEPLLAASHAITVPDVPPAAWFEEPQELPPFGALTVTDEGRVYGLLAPRDVAHRSYQNKRVTVPTGNVDYTRWMNRETIVEGGQRLMTGPITMDCGHASTDPGRTAQASMEHYDNSCSLVATVRIGENRHGVWVAGALLPGVTPVQVTRMLACQLSGDWRKHREEAGQRELVAALLVPVPGFATASRASVRLDQGELVASAVPVTWKLAGDVPSDEDTLVATVIGSTDLPIADRDMGWDGSGARSRVFDSCTSGDTVDTDCVARAFLFRDPDQDAENRGAYSLGFADIVNDRLQIVPRGVAATAGGRGVDAADIPADEKDRIKSRICTLYNRIRDRFDDWPECPFERDDAASLEANDAYAAGEIDFDEWKRLLSTDSTDTDVPEEKSNGAGEFDADFPSWEDVVKKRELRAQTEQLAAQLQQELGIEIGV